MPVDPATVTAEQIAQLALLVSFRELSDDTARTLLAERTAAVIVRDPATKEPLQGPYGVLTAPAVDTYGVAAQLWEERAWRLLQGEEPRQVTGERNGDVSRNYGEGGGPMTHAKAMAVAARLWRRALAKPAGRSAKVVEVLPPASQRGYFDPSDPASWPEPVYGPGVPADLSAGYVVNRPEVGS